MHHENKNDTLELDFKEGYSLEKQYSAWRQDSQNRFLGRLLGKSRFFLLIGVVIVGIFVLAALLFQRSRSFDSEIKMGSLERRIKPGRR